MRQALTFNSQSYKSTSLSFPFENFYYFISLKSVCPSLTFAAVTVKSLWSAIKQSTLVSLQKNRAYLHQAPHHLSKLVEQLSFHLTPETVKSNNSPNLMLTQLTFANNYSCPGHRRPAKLQQTRHSVVIRKKKKSIAEQSQRSIRQSSLRNVIMTCWCVCQVSATICFDPQRRF